MPPINATEINGRSNPHDDFVAALHEIGENGKRKNGITKPDTEYKYESLVEAANFIQSQICIKPHIGIICGSGLGSLADNIADAHSIPYDKIPQFPVSTVPGHSGKLVFGKICDVPVVVMKGRFHFYEGYPLWKACLLPVRVMKLLGVKSLITTNAAGGLNPSYKLGDLMILKDHINMMGFAGQNPLNGPNDDRFGPRFPAINKAYTAEYRKAAKEIAKELKIDHLIREGVYTCLGGPNFETVAELNMLKMCGVDAVGMSTVPEVITAAHCGMNVFAMSLITNECILSYDTDVEANHQEVLDTGKSREEILKKFITKLVAAIKSIDNQNCKKK